jgi:hypothetical protein
VTKNAAVHFRGVLDERSAALAAFILDLAHTRMISFSPFLSLYSAAASGHKNGVQGHRDGVKKAVLVTRAEWRSHEWSEQDRSLVTSESQKRSEAGILKCSCDRNYRNIL